jgi:hypothetical protein
MKVKCLLEKGNGFPRLPPWQGIPKLLFPFRVLPIKSPQKFPIQEQEEKTLILERNREISRSEGENIDHVDKPKFYENHSITDSECKDIKPQEPSNSKSSEYTQNGHTPKILDFPPILSSDMKDVYVRNDDDEIDNMMRFEVYGENQEIVQIERPIQFLNQLLLLGHPGLNRDFIRAEMTNLINQARDSNTNLDLFLNLFNPFKEMVQTTLIMKHGTDLANLMFDPVSYVRKSINLNQYCLKFINRVKAGNMTALNQLRCTFVNRNPNLENVINVLNPIVMNELFQVCKYLLLERIMEHDEIILNMWRGEPGTIDPAMIGVI